MELRPYQTDAISALFDYWAIEGSGDGLIDVATGCGKSLIMAEIIRRLVDEYDGLRVIVATHVKELIEQSYLELLNLWHFAPAGIYSAGLNQRRTQDQITFAGIQSAHRCPEAFGHTDLLLIDEAHLVPPGARGMYGKFIAALRAMNPDMRVAGLTASPWRLGSGSLTAGDDAMFDKVVYSYGIADGVRDGYLSRLVSKATETGFDLTGVHKHGGEYVERELQAAVDKADITARAISEAVAYGKDRRSWLAFCSGVEHAFHVRDEIRRRGFSAESVTGTTPAGERAKILADFKAGRIRCLTNNSVLTTGFNAPQVDLLMMLRPTASASLYVQMAGRGTRLAPGKDNCLVLDFAGLIRSHGPVDMVRPPKAKEKGGVAPVKECPKCHSLIHASIMECPDCGHEFEAIEQEKITAKASSLAIMQQAPAEWLQVSERTFAPHYKPEKPTSVLTKFRCGWVTHKNWLCPGHEGTARHKADKFWRAHGGAMPFPRSAEDWIARAGELLSTAEISVKPDGKYMAVVDAKAGEVREVVAVAPEWRRGGAQPAFAAEEYDDIPF